MHGHLENKKTRDEYGRILSCEKTSNLRQVNSFLVIKSLQIYEN